MAGPTAWRSSLADHPIVVMTGRAASVGSAPGTAAGPGPVCGGSLAAFLLTLLVFFGDAKIYLFDVLPKYARSLSFGSEYSHSLPTYVGDSWRLYGS